jgi:hypothetical protein
MLYLLVLGIFIGISRPANLDPTGYCCSRSDCTDRWFMYAVDGTPLYGNGKEDGDEAGGFN